MEKKGKINNSATKSEGKNKRKINTITRKPIQDNCYFSSKSRCSEFDERKEEQPFQCMVENQTAKKGE